MNQATTPTPTKRIEYIDALRGFTMILVVFSHVELRFGLSESFINGLFILFRMPLFFFISGFIGYKANMVWNRQTWWAMSKKKLWIQLFPTLVFGLIYTYAYCHVDFNAFVTNSMKYGYWFTFVLLQMFLIVYSINLLVYKNNSKLFKRYQLLSIVVLTGLLCVFDFHLKTVPSLSGFYNIFSLHLTFKYFPYFAFGYICSMFKNEFDVLINSKIIITTIIVLFVTLFYVKTNFINSRVEGSIIRIVCETTLGFLGLLIVYNTFRLNQDAFTSDKKVGKILQYIGKRTLDIYLLHYFFLPYFPKVGEVLSIGNNTILELICGGGFSLFIVGVCLVVSNVLRTSPILAKYLFGAKK